MKALFFLALLILVSPVWGYIITANSFDQDFDDFRLIGDSEGTVLTNGDATLYFGTFPGSTVADQVNRFSTISTEAEFEQAFSEFSVFNAGAPLTVLNAPSIGSIDGFLRAETERIRYFPGSPNFQPELFGETIYLWFRKPSTATSRGESLLIATNEIFSGDVNEDGRPSLIPQFTPLRLPDNIEAVVFGNESSSLSQPLIDDLVGGPFQGFQLIKDPEPGMDFTTFASFPAAAIIPEPSALSLVGLGVIAVLLGNRRRR